MSAPPITIRDSAPVEQAAREMAVRKIGCLPVVDESDRFVGLITETDLLRYFAGLPPTA